MTITVREVAGESRSPQRFGTLKVAFKESVMDNSYPTGGESLTAAMLGLNKVLAAQIEEVAPGTTKYVYAYDATAEKIQVYTSGANAQDPLAELSNTSATQDGKVLRILAFGY